MGCFAACALEKDSVSFIAFDRSGNIITCNRAFTELTGYTREKIALMPWPGEFLPGPERTTLSEAIARLNTQGSHRCESLIRKEDESLVPVEMYIHAFGDGDVPACYYSFIMDTVERKRIEKILLQSQEDLEKRVRKRTEELERSATALKISRTQSELYLDVLSHDIRNLNQAILGYLEIALEKFDPLGEDRELLTRPIELLNNSSRLVDNVKKLRSIAIGALDGEVDLGEILHTVVREYPMKDTRGSNIRIHAPENCLVKGSTFLRDVFANLVDNAIKHSNGSVNISINVTEHRENGGKYYHVCVEDDGPGICDNLKDKLFPDLAGQSVMAGRRGIGLQLSKAIVDALHGRIWVEDRITDHHQMGCRFVVMLPAVEK